MPDRPRRLAFDVTWGTLGKMVCTAALIWIFLQLYQLILLVIVAVLLAVALDPVVARLERRGLARWAAAAVVGFTLLVALGAFFYVTWSSLSSQAGTMTSSSTRTACSYVSRSGLP